MWGIVSQSICSYSDLDYLVDPILGDIETEQCQYISSPHPIILIFCTLSFYSRYLYSPHLSILWIFYGASILLIPVSCGYFMDFPENYKRKRMWLSIIPTNSNFLSPHRLISFLSSPHLTNESLKRTICWFPGHMLRPKHVGGVWRLYSKPSGVWNFKQSEQSQRRGKVRQSIFFWGPLVTNDERLF